MSPRPAPEPSAASACRAISADRGEALTEDVQLEKIQQWCAVADLELVDVLRDVDRSGKDFDARGRPAFDELLSRLRPGRPTPSSCTACRASGATSTRQCGPCVSSEPRGSHSASERLDLESPNGRLMFNVMASFDEYELDVRREYWAETKARVMKQRGVHLGRTPIGYLRASKQPKRECDVTLERAAELLGALGSQREPVDRAAGPRLAGLDAGARRCASCAHRGRAAASRGTAATALRRAARRPRRRPLATARR